MSECGTTQRGLRADRALASARGRPNTARAARVSSQASTGRLVSTNTSARSTEASSSLVPIHGSHSGLALATIVRSAACRSTRRGYGGAQSTRRRRRPRPGRGRRSPASRRPRAHRPGSPATRSRGRREPDRQRRVEPAQPVPHVAADECGGRPYGEDVADRVVLTLVDLAVLEPGLATAGDVERDAHLAQVHPASQASTFGPSTVADGMSSATASSASSAPARARRRRAAARPTPPCRRRHARSASRRPGPDPPGPPQPNPAVRGAPRTDSSPRPARRITGDSSTLPVSTATTRCGGRVWFCTAVSTSGSHRAPSWLTRTAVTWCRGRATRGERGGMGDVKCRGGRGDAARSP